MGNAQNYNNRLEVLGLSVVGEPTLPIVSEDVALSVDEVNVKLGQSAEGRKASATSEMNVSGTNES